MNDSNPDECLYRTIVTLKSGEMNKIDFKSKNEEGKKSACNSLFINCRRTNLSRQLYRLSFWTEDGQEIPFQTEEGQIPSSGVDIPYQTKIELGLQDQCQGRTVYITIANDYALATITGIDIIWEEYGDDDMTSSLITNLFTTLFT